MSVSTQNTITPSVSSNITTACTGLTKARLLSSRLVTTVDASRSPSLPWDKDLPPHLQQQVIVLAQTLVKQHRQKAEKPLKQSWASAMRDYRDQYTALSLQQEVVG